MKTSEAITSDQVKMKVMAKAIVFILDHMVVATESDSIVSEKIKNIISTIDDMNPEEILKEF